MTKYRILTASTLEELERDVEDVINFEGADWRLQGGVSVTMVLQLDAYTMVSTPSYFYAQAVIHET